MTLVLLLTAATGAWAQTGENIFQYCYDCQRNPAFPKTTSSATLSGFQNPYVGYNGSGIGSGNTSAGPWKMEYMGIWSTTDNYEIDDVSYYQNTYGCTDVPVFRLYQWNATANEYQHAAYGVVCCYAKVSNAVEHTALFVSQDGWGCVLTNSSHSSSMNITFDEDLTTGLTTLIAAATPNASSATAVEVTWDATSKTGTFDMPGGNVELEPEYYPQATAEGAVTAATGVAATTDDALVTVDETMLTGVAKMMYYVSTSTTAPAYDAEGWTDVLPTAANYTEAGNLNVWYYPVGTDEGVDDATATYSDGDICATALTVTLAPAPTYAVTLKEDTDDATSWKGKAGTGDYQELPLESVAAGTAVTVKYNGALKVKSVKAKKKAAAPATPALNLTSPAVGQVIGDDGKNYAYGSLPDGVTAVAKICYVSGSNGLALALADEGKMNWSTAQTTCAAHTAPFTGGTWKLATKDEWSNMISAAGSYSALRDGFNSVGGTNMQSGYYDYYWSSTEDGSFFAWYYDDYEQEGWDKGDKDYDYYVRACLAW